MAKELKPNIEETKFESISDTLTASLENLKRRIGAIYPFFLLANLVGIFLHLLGHEDSVMKVLEKCVFFPFDCCFLSLFRFPIAGVIGVSWYLSALFSALWCIYPLVRRWYEICIYVVPVLGALVLGMFGYYFGSFDVIGDTLGFLQGGFLRAFIMIFLGVFIYELSLKLKDTKWTITGKVVLTLTELGLWAGVFSGMILWQPDLAPRMDFLVIFFMICAMTVTMSGQSYWYNKFDYAIILFLGKFSMPLFLNHLAWIKYWPVIAHRTGISFSGEQDILISVLFAIGTSCFIMYGGNVLKKISLKNVLMTKN